MTAMNRTKVFHSNFYSMGTRMDIVLPYVDDEEGDEIFQSIRLEVKRLEKKLSRFDENGFLYYVNTHAFKKSVAVDSELFNIVKNCQDYFVKTNGYFDITQRKLMDYWKSDGQEQKQLDKLVSNLGTDNILLDDQNKTIRFKNEFIEIDLGGYGKGYALENVQSILMDHSIKSAFISFGDSSVLTVGTHPFGDYWGVGIRNLYVHTENAYTFKVRNNSVSTSGVTPIKKGTEWGHVINPKTGIPVRGSKTVSVSSPSPLQAEVLSTVLLISDQEVTKEIIGQFKVDEAIELVYSDDKNHTVRSLMN